ncbi:hypothetical protein PsYK624_077400 [Phanerochaete sordida]|uniref:Uncharacterized protein n=1 Tax=Phanerochaete sordida TaxID=48140 RepID=A0A9P3GD04_9APHY|nr:hypothetical protein PsYK624_077400 [Phanerochaete sordida]
MSGLNLRAASPTPATSVSPTRASRSARETRCKRSRPCGHRRSARWRRLYGLTWADPSCQGPRAASPAAPGRPAVSARGVMGLGALRRQSTFWDAPRGGGAGVSARRAAATCYSPPHAAAPRPTARRGRRMNANGDALRRGLRCVAPQGRTRLAAPCHFLPAGRRVPP